MLLGFSDKSISDGNNWYQFQPIDMIQRQKRLDDLSNKIEDVKKKIEEGREQLKQEAMGKEVGLQNLKFYFLNEIILI